MATTKDEQPKAQVEEEEVVVAKSVTKKDVLKAFNAGRNYYQLAREFFDSESDEAVARVRTIVESEVEQN